ncbi:hypothetical protein PISMIDRAFT_683994 [Pisolithus microcarpus 441]|uniref:Ubiquitin-like domain-containing protein n=1 Tax=Pisolithus microcarpus 441 TaxID=765257 RepID=A0A0C9ZFA8_9AGAM|nr:hypothetical protein PISMIDRAFT_683994 [Pisolithus microcarpus 441]
MPSKKIGALIPVRIRTPWKGKSSRVPHDDYSVTAGLYDVSACILASDSSQISPAPDQQPSTAVHSFKTSHILSSRNVSDAVQITLPVVQAAVEAIPVAGAPLKAAISGLLAVLQVIDRRIQNREDLDCLTRRLYNLSCHIANAPATRTPFGEASRRTLIKVLEDTTIRLSNIRSRTRGSTRLTQDLAGCSSKINDYLLEFTALSQMQLQADLHRIVALLQTHPTPTQCTMIPGCVKLVDATGREHNMLLDQCRSFDRLLAFLPGILHQCRPDEAWIQQWYIDRGQYDFVIDNGIDITQLTRESDIWSTIQPETIIVMRVIATKVAKRVFPRYQCYCGTWSYFEVDEAAALRALEHGVTITW